MGFSFSCLGSYTLPMELAPPNKRWIVGVSTELAWSIGTAWFTLTAYLFRDWKVAFSMNAIPLLSAILYPFLLPESPRWLLQQGDNLKQTPYYRAGTIRSKESNYFFAHSMAEIIALLSAIDSTD